MKKLLTILLIVVALVLSGCVVTIEEKGGSVAAETEKVENIVEIEYKMTEHKAEPESVDYLQMYADVLDRYHIFITHGKDIFEGSDGLTGFEEWGPYEDSEKHLDFFGYVLKDLNNDDVPELLVGERECVIYYEESNHILSIYTLDDGTPKLIFEGWGRNRYYFTENGGFYNEGSSGAASSSETLYSLGAEGELICHGHYFTEPNEDWSETYHYYNTTGECDIENSEMLDKDSVDELHPEFDEWYNQIVFVEMTPFSEYEVSAKNRIVPPVVTCKLFPEGLEGFSSCEAFVPYPDDEFSRLVVYSVDKEVKDFKVLALSYGYVEKSWPECDFEITELYTLEKLTPEKPILVGLEPQAGYYPKSAISYVDETGKTRYFAVMDDFTGEYYPISLCEFE